MSEPNFLDARISRHKVETGETTPTEVAPRRRLWLKGPRWLVTDDAAGERTVVELDLPEEALAVLEDLTEPQLEALADLPIFDTDPTPNTAPLRGDSGELEATTHWATDGTRTAALSATSTAVGVVGDGSVPTVVQADGEVALVRAGDTRLALTGSGDVVLQTFNIEAGWQTRATLTISAGELLTTASTVRWLTQAITTTLRNSSGVALLEADAPMRIQPAQAVSGAGPDLTIGGGPGQTPGTHLAGATIVDVGAPVANVTEALQVRSGATRLLDFGQIAANHARMGLNAASGWSLTLSANAGVMFVSAGQFVIDGFGQWIHRVDFDLRGPSNTDLELRRRGRLTTTTSGAQNVLTYAIPNNTGGAFVACIAVTNITSKETSWFWLRFVAQNNAGTGSDAGAAVDVVPAIAEAGLTATVDRSGTTVRVRIDAPDTDSREARALLIVYPSSLV